MSVRLRPYVHKQVGTLAGSPHEQSYERCVRLVVLVAHLISPHSVHRLTCFQRQTAYLAFVRKARGVLARQVALKHLEVFALNRRPVVVVAYEACRLQAVYHGILLAQAPVEVGLVPHSVKPYCAYLAVVGQQLGQLVVHKLIVALPIAVVLSARPVARVAQRIVVFARPVEVRVIQMKLYALLVALVCQLLYHVASEGRGVNNVIVGIFCVEHREAVVVACGDAYIPRSCLLDGLNPFARVEARGVESRCGLGILVAVEPAAVEIPLALSEKAVDAPVEEYSELVVAKLFARLQVFGRRHVACLLRMRHARHEQCGQA